MANEVEERARFLLKENCNQDNYDDDNQKYLFLSKAQADID